MHYPLGNIFVFGSPADISLNKAVGYCDLLCVTKSYLVRITTSYYGFYAAPNAFTHRLSLRSTRKFCFRSC
jgi:hypothetical protein